MFEMCIGFIFEGARVRLLFFRSVVECRVLVTFSIHILLVGFLWTVVCF